MKIDFHVHTKFSPDSVIRPEDLARKSKKLKVIPAVTDHNSVSALQYMRKQKVPFISGEEVHTDRGDLIGLFVNEHIPKGTEFAETADRIREQGGIVYLPHMYDVTRAGTVPKEKEAAKIDIVEIFNARCMSDMFNLRARLFAKKHNKLMAAGSDTHFLWEFGTTYTELPDFDLDDPKALLKALEKSEIVGKKAP
ncbi:TPA: PHP domain-containing protein, partial [Candidatus Micrarchaeota archaeon]|nr:PHP domain-containing protein [Candidatus Micrarchaeota archaeon]